MSERKHSHLYFVGPWVDGLVMGGLSILIFLYYHFGKTGYDRIQVSSTALALAAFLNWLVNYPHFAATNLRFYQSRLHRETFRLTAYLVPALLLLATVACFVWRKEFSPAWVKVFIMWSAYHYSGQNLGLTLIYARRAGVEVSRGARLVLVGFLYGCFVAQFAEMEALGGAVWVLGIDFPLLGLPRWMPVAMRAFSGLLGCALIVVACVWMRKEKRVLPWIVALPVVAHFVWTLIGAYTFSFQALVPFFHVLQYLLIAWAMEMHEGGEKGQSMNFLSLRWGAINLALGAFLFYGLPRLVALGGFDLAFCISVFFFIFQVHHFFVDGVIWKIRGEGKRSPLFTHFSAAFAKEGK